MQILILIKWPSNYGYIRPIKAIPVTIDGFSHYLISYWGGVVINTRNRRTTTGWSNEQRYRRIKLFNSKEYSNQYIHRLAALAWITNEFEKTDVNHIYPIRSLNSVPNLEWLTHTENMAYIYNKETVPDYLPNPNDGIINKAPF